MVGTDPGPINARAGQAPASPKAPGDLQEGAGALAVRIFEARRLVDDQQVEERLIVGNSGELTNQPGHQIDTDHGQLALSRRSEERPRRPDGNAMKREPPR